VVDIATLALTHGLMAIALWRLLWRDDLDDDVGAVPRREKPWLRRPPEQGEEGR
jgi:hypothetical protein